LAGPTGSGVDTCLPLFDAHTIDPAKPGKEDDGGRQLLFPQLVTGSETRPGGDGGRGGKEDGHGKLLGQGKSGHAVNSEEIDEGENPNP